MVYGPGSLKQAHAVDEWIDLMTCAPIVSHVAQASLAFVSEGQVVTATNSISTSTGTASSETTVDRAG